MAVISKSLFPLTFLAAMGCGLMAGGFFVFSAFIMKSLARLPPKEGIATMQSINVVVVSSWFLAVFMATTVLCGLLIIFTLLKWQSPGSIYRLAGSIAYLIGNFLVTGICNVPLNDRLAAVHPASPEAAAFWASYLVIWTQWNHVRTVTALAAAALLTVALLDRAPSP